MLTFLTRRLHQRRRRIFRYWDGARWRSCDPIDALLRLQGHPEYNYQLHPNLVDEGDEEALRITCKAVRETFGIPEYDADKGVGLTISEILALMVEFAIYMDGLKKSTELPPTSPSSTELTSNASSEPITSGSSDSGSTVIAPISDTPTTSAMR